jgi:uncharacterized membrane protein
VKFTVEVTIDLPRERVMALFDDLDNLYKWQDGLRSFEHVSGEPGQVGARSKMVYDMGNRQVTMIETITSRNLPDEYAGTYEATGVLTSIRNRFYEDGPHRTRWVADHEYKFSGPMKIMSLAIGGIFPRRTQETMDAFKAFAESEGL